MTDRSVHLVERAAAYLRSSAGLSADIGNDLPPVTPSTGASPTAYAADRVNGATVLPAPLQAASETSAIARVDLEALLRAGLSVAGQQRSRIAEECHIVVDQVLRSLRSARNTTAHANLMLVTSARPGEGKTFAALNLAASIVQNDHNEVLLVDMDGKTESMTSQLGLKDAPGLLNLAADPSLRIDNLVVRTAMDGLLYLPTGSRGLPGLEGGGMTRSVSAAIERVARRFPRHIVVLDCAPCLSSSDPIALAPLVAQIVLVVEAERTQRNEIESSLDLVRACPNVMLLLNKARMVTGANFGSYYHAYDTAER